MGWSLSPLNLACPLCGLEEGLEKMPHAMMWECRGCSWAISQVAAMRLANEVIAYMGEGEGALIPLLRLPLNTSRWEEPLWELGAVYAMPDGWHRVPPEVLGGMGREIVVPVDTGRPWRYGEAWEGQLPRVERWRFRWQGKIDERGRPILERVL